MTNTYIAQLKPFLKGVNSSALLPYGRKGRKGNILHTNTYSIAIYLCYHSVYTALSNSLS